jgi:hypothetical protein
MPAPQTPDFASKPASPFSPGFSRDRDLERARGLNRPADSNLDANDRADDPAPDRWIHISPGDPD